MNKYARQMILPEIGEVGQEKLKSSHALIAGIGGLGSIASVYLCRAGIGHMTIVDSDNVMESDLNRQILYTEKDVGEQKVFLAGSRLSETNSDTEVIPIHMEISEENVLDLVTNSDVIVDGTDNFRTKLILNWACQQRGIPYIYGGISGYKGTAMTIIPGRTPCLACLLPPNKKQPASPIPAMCAAVGIIAAVQVMEVLKLILNFGALLAGKLFVFDGKRLTFREVDIKKRSDCTICSGIRS